LRFTTITSACFENLGILSFPPVGANSVAIVALFNYGALIAINLLRIHISLASWILMIKEGSEQFVSEITPTRVPH
jgi:hypothetical protein